MPKVWKWPKKIDTIVLDKTGTITEGKPVVTDIVWETENADIQRIFLGLEKHSEHPLATAVVQALSRLNSGKETRHVADRGSKASRDKV